MSGFRAVTLCLAIALGGCSGAIQPPERDASDRAQPIDAFAELAVDAMAAHDDSVDAIRAADVMHIDVASDVPAGPTVGSPCGEFHGSAAWNCESDGVTLRRSVSGTTESVTCPNGCVSMPFGFNDQCRVRGGAVSDVVNGHAMNSAESSWTHYVAYCVVPFLQGTRDERLTAASRVTWWALKEGVLDVSNPDPVGFSLCTTGSGDVRIGPTATCASGSPWQVGASGVQVTCCSLSQLESSAASLFPGSSSDAVLSAAASEANYLPGTATGDAIIHSTGALRASWLLRSSVIGFTFQAPIVTRECIDLSDSWCYSAGWSPSSEFAPTRAAAMQSISDLHALLDALAE